MKGMTDGDQLDDDSNDVLCGAQLHRMISVRKEQLQKEVPHFKSDYSKGT